MTSGGNRKQIENHALAYLKAVKDVLDDKKESYNYFLELLKDYKDKRIDVEDAIAKVKELFKEHKDLLLGLNTFLPSSHQITFSLEDEQPPNRMVNEYQISTQLENEQPLNEQIPQNEIIVPSRGTQPPQKMPNQSQKVPLGNELPPVGRTGGYEDATKFVSKIKARFEGDDFVYKSFLDNINMLGEGKRSIAATYQEVASLLEGHQDLLEELIQFFPPVLQEDP